MLHGFFPIIRTKERTQGEESSTVIILLSCTTAGTEVEPTSKQILKTYMKPCSSLGSM